jgi:hypothetical protein
MTTLLERQFRQQILSKHEKNFSFFLGEVSEEAKVASISPRNEPESGTFMGQIDCLI